MRTRFVRGVDLVRFGSSLVIFKGLRVELRPRDVELRMIVNLIVKLKCGGPAR